MYLCICILLYVFFILTRWICFPGSNIYLPSHYNFLKLNLNYKLILKRKYSICYWKEIDATYKKNGAESAPLWCSSIHRELERGTVTRNSQGQGCWSQTGKTSPNAFSFPPFFLYSI